jgi:hypothetical protein
MARATESRADGLLICGPLHATGRSALAALFGKLATQFEQDQKAGVVTRTPWGNS